MLRAVATPISGMRGRTRSPRAARLAHGAVQHRAKHDGGAFALTIRLPAEETASTSLGVSPIAGVNEHAVLFNYIALGSQPPDPRFDPLA